MKRDKSGYYSFSKETQHTHPTEDIAGILSAPLPTEMRKLVYKSRQSELDALELVYKFKQSELDALAEKEQAVLK